MSEEKKDEIKISYDIPEDMEEIVDIALKIISDMPRDDVESLATPTLISQLRDDKALYYKYWLKYKGEKKLKIKLFLLS